MIIKLFSYYNIDKEQYIEVKISKTRFHYKRNCNMMLGIKMIKKKKLSETILDPKKLIFASAFSLGEKSTTCSV